MDIKQRIIESSVLLFKEKGYSRTSVEDIVRKCRISKASLYKVFDSKKKFCFMHSTYSMKNCIGKTMS